MILTNAEIREMCDIKIFVHADSDETILKPMHDQFIEPTKEYADIIIPNNKYNTVAVDIVRTIVNEKLV